MGKENEKGYADVFGKIRKIFDFLGDIYFRITDYKHLSELNTGNINKNIELIGEIGRLNQRLKDVTFEKGNLNKKVSELEVFVKNYQKGILESQEYKELEQAKEKTEAERDKYEKQVVERGNIIDHLKEDKKRIMEFADYVIREKSNEGLISFLRNSKIPYVLLNPEERTIIFYNESFEKELGIGKQADLKGKKYHAILDGRDKEGKLNAERIKHIRKFLDLNIKKEFDNVNFEKDGKRVPLHITKQPPVSIKIELGPLRKAGKESKVITCIPLVVEKATTWQKYHPHKLDEVLAETEKGEEFLKEVREKSPGIHRKLIHLHGWSPDKILKKEKKVGEAQAYIDFRKYLSNEKKKAARIRLKKIKAERKKREEKREEKRDKVIKSFKKAYKIKKRDVTDLWDNSRNFQDFIYRCREISRKYREQKST